MGLFDIFSNDAAQQAAAKNTALYASLGQNNSNLFNAYGSNANAALTGGVAGATGALDTGLASSTGAVTNGINTATGAGRSAVDAYAPLTALGQKYGGASSLYLDALGVNGPGGTDRAKAAFTTGPGYQFQVDQATDAAARKASSLGMAASGNTLDAIRGKAQGIASGEYGSYLDRLGGFVNPELSATGGAASGIAGAYRNLGDIGMQGGAALAGLYGNDAAARASLASADATNRVGVAGNVASGLTSANKDTTSGLASANNAQAQAAQSGSKTFWDGLFSVAGNAAKAAFPVPRAA